MEEEEAVSHVGNEVVLQWLQENGHVKRELVMRPPAKTVVVGSELWPELADNALRRHVTVEVDYEMKVLKLTCLNGAEIFYRTCKFNHQHAVHVNGTGVVYLQRNKFAVLSFVQDMETAMTGASEDSKRFACKMFAKYFTSLRKLPRWTTKYFSGITRCTEIPVPPDVTGDSVHILTEYLNHEETDVEVASSDVMGAELFDVVTAAVGEKITENIVYMGKDHNSEEAQDFINRVCTLPKMKNLTLWFQDGGTLAGETLFRAQSAVVELKVVNVRNWNDVVLVQNLLTACPHLRTMIITSSASAVIQLLRNVRHAVNHTRLANLTVTLTGRNGVIQADAVCELIGTMCHSLTSLELETEYAPHSGVVRKMLTAHGRTLKQLRLRAQNVQTYRKNSILDCPYVPLQLEMLEEVHVEGYPDAQGCIEAVSNLQWLRGFTFNVRNDEVKKAGEGLTRRNRACPRFPKMLKFNRAAVVRSALPLIVDEADETYLDVCVNDYGELYEVLCLLDQVKHLALTVRVNGEQSNATKKSVGCCQGLADGNLTLHTNDWFPVEPLRGSIRSLSGLESVMLDFVCSTRITRPAVSSCLLRHGISMMKNIRYLAINNVAPESLGEWRSHCREKGILCQLMPFCE